MHRYTEGNRRDLWSRRFFACKKPMQLSKDYHVAGELEGAKAPLEIQIIAIKKRLRYQTF